MASVEVARRPRVGLLQAAISLAALAGIVWWASQQQRPHVPLDRAVLARLTLALGIYAVAMLMRAERWHRMLPARAGEVMRLHRPSLGYLLVLRFILFVPITVVGFAIFVGRYARRWK